MAIDYAEANLAWDEKCSDDERWLKEHADRTCGECGNYKPSPCECPCGYCSEYGEFVDAGEKVKDIECFDWRKR